MSNEILKFGDTASGDNILTQAEYSADLQRSTGNQAGIARRALVNKVLRQCAFISNAFADYLVARVGGDVLDNNDSAALLAKITAAFTFTFANDNTIINGNFDFWQRNTTFNLTVSGYTADRFTSSLNGSTAVVTRQSTIGTEAYLARYFKRTTVTSVVGVSNFSNAFQKIEDVRRLAGKTMILSFWAKADSNRNMSVEFSQTFGTGGTPSADVTTLGVQKLALTTSWQKFTKVVTLPSISGKIIGTNENSATLVLFWFDVGANFNSRTDSLGQQSGTFDIAQVKFEESINATAFTLAGKTFAGELAACQRFYEKSYNIDENPGTSTFAGALRSNVNTARGDISTGSTVFSTTKRVSPTVAIFAVNGTINSITRSDNVDHTGGVTLINTGTKQVGRIQGSSTSLTTGSGYDFHFTADAEL